jgi:hypothetical protein
VLYEDGEELNEDLVAQDWQLVERKEAVEQPQPATAFDDVGILLDDVDVAPRQVHAKLNSRQGQRAASFAARAKLSQGSEAPVQERRNSQECRQKEHDKIDEKVGSYSYNQLMAALRAGGHGSDIPKGSTVRQRQREAETVVLQPSFALCSSPHFFIFADSHSFFLVVCLVSLRHLRPSLPAVVS